VNESSSTSGGGWVAFAAVMLLIAAAFDFVWAMTAFLHDGYFVDDLLFGNLTAWGVLYLIGAIVLALTALLVSVRSPVGRVLGVFLASVNVLGALLTVGAHPVWSISIMVADVLVIYALTARWTSPR
jgi:hypothetical protein